MAGNRHDLQRIAAEGGENGSAADLISEIDAWHTAKTLMESVRFDEMVDPRSARRR